MHLQFRPHAITIPHLDFGNLAWGWCVITALGRFNPDCRGHLILEDLKLVICFPPGSTILIPSANPLMSSIAHSSSTPLGVCFIRNGFKTDDAFEPTATKEEKSECAQEA
ncbi:hypothetical protein C8F04DRAFT_969588 [Mycena alexandri]|uniref:Uncharacterized protein n=1 Tax=Mycena alexandri TaxID=1745969 RepID=A0AAD6WT34_9AGAR|nr:hypothetical protein C8F04DRAFT_969588 [Mycena alexandri]